MLKPEMILLSNWKFVDIYPSNDDKLKVAVDNMYKNEINDWKHFCDVHGKDHNEEYVKEGYEDNFISENTYTVAVLGDEIKFVEELIEDLNDDNLNLNFEVVEMCENIKYILFFIRIGENDWFKLDEMSRKIIG